MREKEQLMRMILRLLVFCLVVSFFLPVSVHAGADRGKDPYDTGELYFSRGDHRRAMQSYRRALGQNDVRAHYRMGMIYEKSGQDRDALKHFQRFMELGRPGAQRDDAARRAQAIAKRLEQDTALSTTLLERGKGLFGEGRYREAEKVLLQAAGDDASNPEIHFYLGEVYMALEEYEKASAEYNKAKESY